jgi:alkylation response protein AidB-like acyl-CoA dehydrogenase
MNFELTERQKQFQNAARTFVRSVYDKEKIRAWDQTHTFPTEVWKKACQSGLMGVHFPEEYGGQGTGITENILIVEELCRGDSGVGAALSLADFSSEVVLRFGTPEQKKRYLLPVAKGEFISGGAYTEPDHGSDITLMFTTASRQGDSYVINGSKIFTTNGMIADFFIVLCQTHPEAKPPYRGQSTILVERGTPGFVTTELGGKMGIRMTSTGQLSFNEVRVPVTHLIGEESRGFYQVLEFFDESRIEIGAQALGMAQGALDRALEHARQRRQFGKTPAGFQITQHKLADMATQVETARLLTYKAAWNYDQGRIDPMLTSMAKMHAGRTAVEITDEAVQIFGEYGCLPEYEVERFYRDAKITEIYEGTKEIQKNTIASSLLGRSE